MQPVRTGRYCVTGEKPFDYPPLKLLSIAGRMKASRCNVDGDQSVPQVTPITGPNLRQDADFLVLYQRNFGLLHQKDRTVPLQ
jgi:hypothetical protein